MSRPTTEASFEVDERIYPLEAVQNAAYAFTDRAFVRLEPGDAGKLKVSLSSKPAPEGPDADTLRGEFDNELVHQALRLRVSESNRKIREFVVTKALVSAQPSAVTAAAAAEAAVACVECAAEGAPSPSAAPEPARIDEALEKEIDRLLAEIEGGDGAGDPLGVAVPWEEKFGAKAKKAEGPKAPAKAKPAAKGGKAKRR